MTAVEEASDADDGVQLQQRKRRLRAVQIDLARADCRCDPARDLGRVDLQADRERELRADAAPDASERFPLDRLVELERAAPERLVAERVVAEDVAPARDERRSLGRRTCWLG